MQKADKERLIEELTERLRAADTLLVADYRGLTNSQLASLRVELLNRSGDDTDTVPAAHVGNREFMHEEAPKKQNSLHDRPCHRGKVKRSGIAPALPSGSFAAKV